MSAWWLVLIIPLSASAGLAAAALLNVSRRSEPAPEPPAAPPAPEIVRVTRYIPKDVWMERILETDVKTANAQLAVSMGQMLGPELEPCPCCGAPGQMKDIHNKIRQGWVGCPACSLYISWKISPDGAIKKWNRRQPSRYKPNYGAMVLAALDPLLELREAVDKLTEILAGGASPAPTKETEVDG